MCTWGVRLGLRSLLGALAAVMIFVAAGTATAQPANPDVAAFLANPSQVLQDSPDGGATLVSAIRALALASQDTLPAIISLLATATSNQESAIGAGLGQAYQALAQSNPDYAAQIASALAASGDQVAITAYAAVTGNVPTTTADGGGGGGGGGVGGAVTSTTPTGGSASGSLGGGGTTSTANSTQNQLTSAGGAVGGSTLAGSAGSNVSP